MKTLKKILARIWHPVHVIERWMAGQNVLSVPVLCYHSVSEAVDADVDPMPVERFRQHMEHIAKHHNPVRLIDMPDYLSGEKILPENPVVVTFDDGYLDNYQNAWPILKSLNIPATIFLVSGFMDGRTRLYGAEKWVPMTWDHAREMQRDGLIDFGAHTDGHPILSGISDDTAKEEIEKSIRIIGEKLGMDPEKIPFAYPFGQGMHVPPLAPSLLRGMGVPVAVSTIWRTLHHPRECHFMNRVMIYSTDDVATLRLKLAGGYDFLYYWQKLRAFVFATIWGKGIWHG